MLGNSNLEELASRKAVADKIGEILDAEAQAAMQDAPM